MGGENELIDTEFCESRRRSSSSGGSLVRSLSSIPGWVALAGGMAIGTMLGRSSGSASGPVMEEGLIVEGVVSCGPWGGAGGNPFYDGRGDIVEIEISYNAEHVLSIETSYSQGGASFKSAPHGTSNGGQTTKITLQYPDEYVMQVKGSTYTWPVIQGTIVSSLTFITNKKVYGPFGKESEAKFESLPGGRVVGFFGRSGTLIDQFGVLAYPSSGYTTTTTTTTTYTTSSSVDQERTVYVEGPYGGNGGVVFNDGYSRIVEIIITYNKKQVTSLQVAYEHGGSVFKGLRHGIHAGEEAKISFNRPEEYLMQVKGTAGKVSGIEIVTSLTFISNKRSFGPYGEVAGYSFETSPDREVTGFLGRSGDFIDQIGIITGTPGYPDTTTVQGPWGCEHGVQFFTGSAEITEIEVTFTKEHLVGLQTTHINLSENADCFKSARWGGVTGKNEKVILRSPEILIQLKGTIDTVNGVEAVTSLTFVTNHRVCGPFGTTSGRSFESNPGKIVGFIGRSDGLLHQIGVISELTSEIHVGRTTRTHLGTFIATGRSDKSGTEIQEHQQPDVKGKSIVPSGSSHVQNSGHWHSESHNSIHETRELVFQCRDEGMKVHGPWGGSGGTLFSDGRGEIAEIVITYDTKQVISVQAYYVHGESTFKGSIHGGDDVTGSKKEKIKFRHPEEILLQVKGTTHRFSFGEGISSLTFVTNEETYGPYGSPTHESFESPRDRKVTGFFGRAGKYLDQLGVFCETSTAQRVVEGPWGGVGGAPFYDGVGDIVEMVVSYSDSQVVSFRTSYGQSGLAFTTGSRGTDDPTTDKADSRGRRPGDVATISLNFPEEYVVQVRGTMEPVKEETIITSLTIVTNKKTYGPYGPESGRRFESSPAGLVRGFYGRTSVNTLDQIGFIVQLPHQPSHDTQYLLPADVLVIPQGPWGAPHGEEFYDGRGDIVEVNIHCTKTLITSIEIGYEQGGTSFLTAVHGGPGEQTVKIVMDSSTEHLVQVRGTTAVVDGSSVITSLILVTNKATYGPYGGVRGRRFQSTKEGKVVGFFGTASTVLHQLGVITLIYAPPGNGLCIRCTTPYLYCCSCTVQHSPVPRPFGPGSTGSHITTHHLLPRPSPIPGTSVVPGGVFSSITVVEGSKLGLLTKDIPWVDKGHDGEFVISFPQGGSSSTSQRPGSTTIEKTTSGGTTTTTTMEGPRGRAWPKEQPKQPRERPQCSRPGRLSKDIA